MALFGLVTKTPELKISGQPQSGAAAKSISPST